MYLHWLSVNFTSFGSVTSSDFSRTKLLTDPCDVNLTDNQCRYMINYINAPNFYQFYCTLGSVNGQPSCRTVVYDTLQHAWFPVSDLPHEVESTMNSTLAVDNKVMSFHVELGPHLHYTVSK